MRLYKNILVPLLSFNCLLYSQDLWTKTKNTAKDSLSKSIFEKLVSTKNLISVNALGFFDASVSLSYLHEFPKRNFHFYVPISVGYGQGFVTEITTSKWFSDGYAIYPKDGFSVRYFSINRKSYEIGFGIHFQTSSKRRISYFYGPYFGTSQFLGTYSEQTAESNSFDFKKKQFILTRFSLMYNHGFLFRIHKNFNASILYSFFGPTYVKFEGQDLRRAYNFHMAYSYIFENKLNLSLGYRF